MSNGLTINNSLDAGQQLQVLLQREAEIKAQIAALQSSSAPSASYTQQQHHRSTINKNYNRRTSNVPRSMSSTGPTMARHPSDQFPAQRSRTLSQRSAPPMTRTSSKGTSSSRSGNTSYIPNNNAMPRPFHLEGRESLSMDTWMDNSTYALSHQPSQLQRSMSQRQELPQVPEMGLGDVGEYPNDFISRTMGTPTLAFSPSFSSMPSSAPRSNAHLTNSFDMVMPSTPTTDSLTTGSTLASNMSRPNSLCNEPMLDSIRMIHVDSSASYSSDVNFSDQFLYDQSYTSIPPTHCNPCSSSEEQSQLLVGTGGISHDSQFSHSFPPADAFQSVAFGEKMEKSRSNESICSNSSSTSSRSKQRLQIAIAAAERPLQPKGGCPEISMSRESSSRSIRIESKNELMQDNKMALHAKPSYQRPKHDRVFCKQCESHPEGFRGEHELRRHQDREHKRMVKKWVCIEPTGNNHPKPELALSKCKACGQQRKKYGAYYNAAAHLRRTHFKPKAKGRSKSAKVDDGEKRGGKGGGDWPPMSELKHWMKEVEEEATDYSQARQDNAVDLSDDEALEGDYNDEHNTPLQSIPNTEDPNTTSYNYQYVSDIVIPASNTNDMYDMSLDLTPAEIAGFNSSSIYGQSQFSQQHFSASAANMHDHRNEAMQFFDNSAEAPNGYVDEDYSWH